ncbi:2,3 cyclic phosphodiesterase, partial [Nadsonia fulvescens var. elongata DSM 6958]
FAPHITITTGIILNHDHSSPESSSSAAKAEIDLILDKALSAARSVPNFTITLQSVKTGAFFFKKVYFEISPSNSALASLAQLSREVFVLLPQAIANQPHYHALSEGDRARIDAEVAKRAQSWAQSEFDPHLSLVYSELYPVNEALQRTINQRLEDALGPGFETRGIGWSGGRLSLVRCEGPIHQWQKLGYRDI